MGIFDILLEKGEENARNKVRISIDYLINLTQIAAIDNQGLDLSAKEIRDMIPSDDMACIPDTPAQDLRLWGACLALRAVKYAGLVPCGWDKISNCNRCGKIWSDHGKDLDICGWCELNEKGIRFPQPDKPF